MCERRWPSGSLCIICRLYLPGLREPRERLVIKAVGVISTWSHDLCSWVNTSLRRLTSMTHMPPFSYWFGSLSVMKRLICGTSHPPYPMKLTWELEWRNRLWISLCNVMLTDAMLTDLMLTLLHTSLHLNVNSAEDETEITMSRWKGNGLFVFVAQWVVTTWRAS